MVRGHATQKGEAVGPIAGVEDRNSDEGAPSSVLPRASRIAILLDFLGNPYSDPIFSELTEIAREHAVSVVWLIGGLLSGADAKPRNFIGDLATRDSVDGVLVVSLGSSATLAEVTEYCSRYRPLPMSSIAVPWKQYPRVEVDNEPGMREAIRHLVGVHGHRRIAFVRGPEASKEAELRYRVYREVLAENGIPFDPDLVAPGFFVMQSGVDAVRLFLDHRKIEIDAIACANDGMAFGVLEELTARGIHVSRQIAVTGFDDTEGCRFTEPPLTTVRQPIREQARAAWDLLLSQIMGRRVPVGNARSKATSQNARLETELVVRESCGCSPLGTHAVDAPPTEARRGGEAALAAPVLTADVRLPRVSSAPKVEDLCAAFATEASTGRPIFLRGLEAALQVAARLNIGFDDFHRLVSALEHEMSDSLSESTPRARRVDALLDASRILVSSYAERVPVGLQHRYEDFSDKLLRANQTIMTARDLGELGSALARHLPAFGVQGCHICVYEGDEAPAEWSRVVASWSRERKLKLPSQGVRFRTAYWLPAELAMPQRWSAHVAYPIEANGKSLGYVVLEHGPAEGHAYERLARQIGAAFHRILLLEELVEQARRRQVAERERLEKEVRMARRIQNGLLPQRVHVPGLEIAACTRSWKETNGHSYDVVPARDGCWITIGSFGGDGLSAGLIMLMLQSVVSGLARNAAPDSVPNDILPLALEVLSDNMKRRGASEPVGLMLLRYHAGGTIVVAGEHGELVIGRAGGRVDHWGGGQGNVPQATYELAPGDVFAVHAAGEETLQRGTPAWASKLDRLRDQPAQAIRDALIEDRESPVTSPCGDVTMLVGKHAGSAATRERA
jgi:sigma-B regulation protein RsbU (phosphoserine phosphatase)